MSTSKSTSKSLTQAPDTPLAPVVYEEDAGGGFEGTSSRDYTVPILTIIQKMSPIADAASSSYNPEAKVGQIINTVTQERMDRIQFIPVHRAHQFVEWIPRKQGGGLVGIHSPSSELVMRVTKDWEGFGKITFRAGTAQEPATHELIETMSMFGLVVRSDDQFEPAVINFASTQLKAYKSWMTTAKSLTFRNAQGQRVPYPLWAHIYELSTLSRSNAKGSWNVWSVQFSKSDAEASRLTPDHELYRQCKALRDLITSGTATMDTSGLTQDADVSSDDLPDNML